MRNQSPFFSICDEFGYYSFLPPWLPETPTLLDAGAPPWRWAVLEDQTLFSWDKLVSLVEALAPDTRKLLSTSPSACQNLIHQACQNLSSFLDEHPSWVPPCLVIKPVNDTQQGFYHYDLNGWWPHFFNTPEQRKQALMAFLLKTPTPSSNSTDATFEYDGRVYLRGTDKIVKPEDVPSWLEVPPFEWEGVYDARYLKACIQALKTKDEQSSISDQKIAERIAEMTEAELGELANSSDEEWENAEIDALLRQYPSLNGVPDGVLHFIAWSLPEVQGDLSKVYALMKTGFAEGGRVLAEDPSRASQMAKFLAKIDQQEQWSFACQRYLSTGTSDYCYAEDKVSPHRGLGFAQLFEQARITGFSPVLCTQDFEGLKA